MENHSVELQNINGSLENDNKSIDFPWMDVIQLTLFVMIFMVSATGNALVCLVVARNGRMRTTRNYLLVNLAVSDLTVALLCIPFDVVVKIASPGWPLGEVMCKVLWPSMTLVTNSSAATLAAISYDRYRAVVPPMKPRFTIRQTGIIIATIWLFSLVLVVPYVVVLRVLDNDCTEIWPNDDVRRTYTVGLFVFQYVLPLIVIAIAYSRVIIRLRKQAVRMAKIFEKTRQLPSNLGVQDHWDRKARLATPACDNASLASPLPEARCLRANASSNRLNVDLTDSNIGGNKEARRLEHNTKIVKMLVSVVLFYAICLLPNQVVWLWFEFGYGKRSPYLNELLTFGSIMVYINSSVNPLLYAGMNEQFRKGFISILRCQWKEKPEMI